MHMQNKRVPVTYHSGFPLIDVGEVQFKLEKD